MPKATNRKKRTSTKKPNYVRFGESYTSLILGIIVVIIGTLLLLSFARNRNITRGNIVLTPPEVTDVKQTNMQNTIKKADISVSPTPNLIPGNTSGTRKTNINVEKNYTVKPGDTLWSIAVNNYNSGYNWVDIARANKLSDPDLIATDTKLVLPKAEQKNLSSEPEWAGSNSTANVNPVQPDNKITTGSYTVKAGDTLWDIALRAYGDSYQWAKIADANKLPNPDLINEGEELTIPR